MLEKWKIMLVLVICTELFGTVIFLRGFFPIKSSLPGRATKNDYPVKVKVSDENSSSMAQIEPMAVFGKMIIVLIDALRADFVIPKSTSDLPRMAFVEELIQKGDTISILAKAHPPTVTMPRIKALTTGGIPGFVDVVLNFDSKALQEDNLIYQLHQAGKRIVFYGDDTWMRLFPDMFSRMDGTTSFFVTDYTEVDNNVTRHIDRELQQGDWDVMILHYLGLDHIGHLAGPHSPLIRPKLQEMDSIIKTLYFDLLKHDKTSALPSLLVLCGDHGMSDQGSHGGSTASETITPLVLMSSLFLKEGGETGGNTQVSQIDMAPTLSLLMGVPIPKNNLGYVIRLTLGLFNTSDRLDVLYYNAYQLLNVLKENVGDVEKEPGYLKYQRAQRLHQKWVDIYQYSSDNIEAGNKLADNVIDMYYQAMEVMQQKVASSLSSYDLHAMIFGIIILWVVLLTLVATVYQSSVDWLPPFGSLTMVAKFAAALACTVSAHLVVCTSTAASDLLCSKDPVSLIVTVGAMLLASSCITIILSVANFHHITKKLHQVCGLSGIQLWFLVSFILHTASLLSSSFVEEEHQTWYFYVITTYIILSIKYVQAKVKPHCKTPECAMTFSKLCPDSSNHDNMLKVRHSHDEDTVHLAGYNAVNRQQSISSSACSQEIDMSYYPRDKPTLATKKPPENLQERTNRKTQKDSMFGLILPCGAFVVAACLCRVLRMWNQTGDKWSHIPDVGDWLVRPDNKAVLSLSCVASLLVAIATRCQCDQVLQPLLMTAACTAIYCFRAAQGAVMLPGVYTDQASKGVMEARIAYSIIVLTFSRGIIKYLNITRSRSVSSIKVKVNYNADARTGDHTERYVTYMHVHSAAMDSWLLLMLLLLRPHNMAIVAMLIFLQRVTLRIVSMCTLPVWCVTLFYLMLGQATFFYQGNSNSLATVDLSAGYIGLQDYQPVLVAILMGLSTYAGLFFWLLTLIEQLLMQSRSKEGEWSDYMIRWKSSIREACHILCMTRALPLAVYSVLVTLQRYHLFVWTVFSPKLLYEGMLTLMLSLVVALLTVICR